MKSLKKTINIRKEDYQKIKEIYKKKLEEVYEEIGRILKSDNNYGIFFMRFTIKLKKITQH